MNVRLTSGGELEVVSGSGLSVASAESVDIVAGSVSVSSGSSMEVVWRGHERVV